MKTFFAEYDHNIYDKEAILKAAYAFSDAYFVHIESSADGNYAVTFHAKEDFQAKEDFPAKAEENAETSGDAVDDIGKRFENELLAQMVRRYVNQETKEVRVMLVAKALASSMIGEELVEKMRLCDGGKVSKYDVESLVRAWYAESF